MRQTIRIALFSMALVGMLAATASATDVHVNVRIGSPPPIIVHSPPRMVYLPEPALYVAVGIPYDVYLVGGRYYYYRDTDWYWGPAYKGPWTPVVYRSLPPGLRKYPAARLHDFRDREYRVYLARESDHHDRYAKDDHRSQGKGRGRGHSKR